METEIFSYVMEYGSLGLFCSFLLYLNKTQMSKHDQLVEEFRKSINETNAVHEKTVTDIRKRTDKVIEQYRQERDEALREHADEREANRKALEEKLSAIERSLTSISVQMSTGLDFLNEYKVEQIALEKARQIAKNRK